MKKIKKGYSTTVNLPERVDNVEGDEQIAEKFRSVYHELYNSADTSDGVSIIKDSLRDMIGPESLHEVYKVTGSVVKRAATRMKPGKNDVSDSFTSGILLHTPDSMIDALAAVFRSWIVHGTVSRHSGDCRK